MGRILEAAKRLAPGQDLLLRATFEPIPLYAVLGLRGFRHEARRIDGDDWEIRFSRAGAPGRRGRRGPGRDASAEGTAEPVSQPPASAPPDLGTGEAPLERPELPWLRLDNRGLEPPEPMMRTLQTLNTLSPGQVLEIHNDRRPMFLYPHLRERGYVHQTVDAADGSAFVRIWRPAASAGPTGGRRDAG